jgi:NitT/TauT family transport system substrate-binding protein
MSDIALYTALSQGMFTQQKLLVSMVKLPSPAVPPALTRGDIDFSNQPSSILAGASRGFPFKVVLLMWKESPWTIVGKPELKSLADLKGKTLGTTAAGSSPPLYLQAAMKKAGMDSGKDLKIVTTRGTEDSYAFLIGGQVDAAILSPPFDAQAQTKGFKEVAFIGDALQIPYSGLGTSSAYIAAHRPIVVRMIKGLLDARDWIKAHPAETAAIASKYIEVPPEIARASVDKMLPLLTETGEGPIEGIKEALDTQAQFSNEPVNVAPEQTVDYGPLHEALGKA